MAALGGLKDSCGAPPPHLFAAPPPRMRSPRLPAVCRPPALAALLPPAGGTRPQGHGLRHRLAPQVGPQASGSASCGRSQVPFWSGPTSAGSVVPCVASAWAQLQFSSTPTRLLPASEACSSAHFPCPSLTPPCSLHSLLTLHPRPPPHPLSFITTDVNPYYDSFVRWQFEVLHKQVGSLPSL